MTGPETLMTRVIAVQGRPQQLLCRRFSLRAADGQTMSSSEAVVVGTSHAAGFQLRDSSVSRLHVRIEPDAHGIRVLDLGSTNGTFVGGLRIQNVHSDRELTVHLGTATLAVALEDNFDNAELAAHGQFGELLGASPAMLRVFAQLQRYAEVASPVLLRGATGTGKELAADAIHAASSRRDGPFVVVDCGALPATLIESELFGHVRGAFTGAHVTRDGAFAQADGGTLFLDEIGELDLSLQPRLLRVLETGIVRRIGEMQDRHIDVRIIAATHRDLAAMVAQGEFREDLYYRLHVLVAGLPPLQDRPGDIVLLARHFAELTALKYSQARPDVLTEDVLAKLATRSWPGNARQLRNFVERAVLLGPRCMDLDPSSSAEKPGVDSTLGFHDARQAAIQRFEREYVEAILARSGGNVAAAARSCGVHRGYLFRLMRRHGLTRS